MPEDPDEVGVSLQPAFSGISAIDARFIRLKQACLAPRIYGQLNILLPAEDIVNVERCRVTLTNGSSLNIIGLCAMEL